MIAKTLPVLYAALAAVAAAGVGYWATPIKPLDLNGVPVKMSEKPAFSWRWTK